MATLIDGLDELIAHLTRAANDASAGHAARAAAFDADGTLWRGDIGDDAFLAAADSGLLTPAAYEGLLRPWAAAWHIELPTDVRSGLELLLHTSATRPFADDTAANTWRESLYQMQAWAFANHPRSAVVTLAENLFDAGFAAGIFADMTRLIRALTDLGIDCFIVSASHGALVEVGARHVGVDPARVLGMEPALDANGVTLPSIARSTFGAGKVRALATALGGRPPLLAFGDSVLAGDRELLGHAHLPVAVAPRGAHREAALQDGRILVFDPL